MSDARERELERLAQEGDDEARAAFWRARRRAAAPDDPPEPSAPISCWVAASAAGRDPHPREVRAAVLLVPALLPLAIQRLRLYARRPDPMRPTRQPAGFDTGWVYGGRKHLVAAGWRLAGRSRVDGGLWTEAPGSVRVLRWGPGGYELSYATFRLADELNRIEVPGCWHERTSIYTTSERELLACNGCSVYLDLPPLARLGLLVPSESPFA